MDKKIGKIIKICEEEEYFMRYKTNKIKYVSKIKIEDETINRYLYINKWSDFLDLYKKFKCIKKDILFYEVLGKSCKFYIDIKFNILNLKKDIDYINEELCKFFKINLKIDVNITV